MRMIFQAAIAVFLASACGSRPASDTGPLDIAIAQDRSIDGADANLGCSPTRPRPIIDVSPSTMVAPQTRLSIDGSRSQATNGSAVTKYLWNVEQPPGSSSSPQPLADSNTPRFELEVNLSGEYTFTLDVVDDEGRRSCTAAIVSVTVGPVSDLVVRLVWTTPGDPDPTDVGPKAGADLDLHMLHPSAAGSGTVDANADGTFDGWFAQPWDCFWFQTRPDWGPGVNDDPRMTRDDTDGAGPEVIEAGPLATGAYAIGVHVWNDNGFGPSTATLQVFLKGKLALSVVSPPLAHHDLWYGALLALPAGIATKVATPDGKPAIATATWTEPAP